MTNTAKLLVAGICPLVVGYLLNFLMSLSTSTFLFFMISLFLLASWAYLAYRLIDIDKNIFTQSFLMCAFALLMLALVMYQELVLGAYWSNIIGSCTQIYFAPFLLLVSLLTPVFSILSSIDGMWAIYLCELILMFLVCVIVASVRSGKKYK